jgi:hypothetical protein
MTSASTDSCAIASTSAGRSAQLRQFTHEVPRAVDGDRLATAEMVTLSNRDLARDDDREAGSVLAHCLEWFTGPKRTQRTKPTHLLDLQRIERRICLISPLFANRLQLQCHDGQPYATVWAITLGYGKSQKV